MKRILYGIAIATTALVFSCYDDNKTSAPLRADSPIGLDIPKSDVRMKDVSGNMVTLKEAMKENGLLVMFSCNTCPAVEANQKRTLEICNYAMQNNIGVILLNSNEDLRDDDDSYTAMQEYAKEQGYKWSYVIDENSVLADALGAKRTPETFLFNKEGKLVYRGAIDNNPQDESAVTRKHLQLAIDELAGGKDITVKTSRSIGCSIKRKG